MKKKNKVQQEPEVFNRIIRPESMAEKDVTQDASSAEGEQPLQQDDDANATSESSLEPDSQADSQADKMPPVKPSTIILMCLFGMLFALGFFFAPYLTQYLPFGGHTVQQESYMPAVGFDYLTQNAASVVIGKVEKQGSTVVSDNIEVNDSKIVYTEQLIAIETVLYGKPNTHENNKLITYTLGGVVFTKDAMGRPVRTTYKYTDAAELGGDKILLFLDSENNIISEKYGVYKLHAEGYFYDSANHVYSLADIQAALAARES